MDDITAVVAENLRQLREQKNLSLTAASRLAGVSKSLWSQIERGEINPTITTVWKIALGLNVSFSELTTRAVDDFEVVETRAGQPISADDGRFRNFPLFGRTIDRPFELYYLDLEPGAHLEAEPHLPGCQEYITVFEGELTVTVDDRALKAGEGAAMRFPGDRPHSYKAGSAPCRLSMIIFYPR